MRATHRAGIGALVLLAVLSARDANAQGEWSYEIVPFLWAASLDGREGVGGTTVDVDAKFKDLLEFVNVGAAMRFTARRAPITWFAEANYVELENDFSTVVGSGNVRAASTLAEGGLAYELNAAFAVYGGVRFQQVDTKLTLAGIRRDQDESWIDGIVGVRWTPLVSDQWVLWARADAGAGGSDLVWLAEAGGGYRWGTRWGAYLAYRLLDTDYESGSFLYDVKQSGLLFGFGVRF